MSKMKELAAAGVRRVPEMQRHVKQYVEHDLFGDQNIPPLSDARFWPNGKVIMNVIYRTRQKTRFVQFQTLPIIKLCHIQQVSEFACHRPHKLLWHVQNEDISVADCTMQRKLNIFCHATYNRLLLMLSSDKNIYLVLRKTGQVTRMKRMLDSWLNS